MTRNCCVEFIDDIEPVRDEPLCPLCELPAVEPVASPVDPGLLLELPVLPLVALPVLLPSDVDPMDEPPARFWIVPVTSTRFPTRLAKFDALPVSRYVVPLIELVEPLVAVPVGFEVELPVGFEVELPVAEPVVPVEAPEPDPLAIEASVRM